MNIVTGYRGVPHITANEIQAFNQGIIGTSNYVLNVGQMFAATLVDAMTVTIADGEGVIQGVHFRIAPGDTDTVSISPGTSGYSRIDYICARYTKNASTGIESVDLVVVEGVPAASSPSAPTVNTGNVILGGSPIDFPLWEVDVNGLTPSLKRIFAPNESRLSEIYQLPFTKPNNSKISSDYNFTRLYIKPAQKLMYFNICFRLEASNTATEVTFAEDMPLAHGLRTTLQNGVMFPVTIMNTVSDGFPSFGTVRGTALCNLTHLGRSTRNDSLSHAEIIFGTAPGARVYIIGAITVPYRRLNINHPFSEAVLIDDDIS